MDLFLVLDHELPGSSLIVKTYKRQSKHNSFITIYYFRATCFGSL